MHRPRRRPALLPLVPAALLLLSASWSGTFQAPLSSIGVAMGHGALFGVALLGLPRWRDPLGMGRFGNGLLLAAIGLSALSWWSSPVPRAGTLGMLLLPAFLLVPAAVAICWRDPAHRRQGVTALYVVAIVITVLAGWRWYTLGSDRPALPLGHHNLLATFLVGLAPITLLALRERGVVRLVGLAAFGLSIATVLATRSLGGGLALAVSVAIATFANRRLRLWGIAIAIASVALLVPRLGDVVSGGDPSTDARWGYVRAGIAGMAARPVLGWGPGAAAWTLAEHLAPEAGVHPPGETVADVHDLPVQLAYELGLAGLLAWGLVIACFLRRRRRAPVGDEDLRHAALLGLLALALAGLAGLPLTVTALPVLAAILAGAALASTSESAREADAEWSMLVPLVVLVVCGIGGAQLDRGQWAYEQARRHEDPEQRLAWLVRAAALDLAHPLYHHRVGSARGDAAARLDAATRARGVAALWLEAGFALADDGDPRARAALLRACDLDPLSAIAPWGLSKIEDDPLRAADFGARALLAEPRMIAAIDWSPDLRRRAVRRVERLAGVDLGWRDALARHAEARGFLDPAGEVWPAPAQEDLRHLGLRVDDDPATSMSMFVFRRAPWPALLASVALDRRHLEGLTLTAATRLPSTEVDRMLRTGCALQGE